MNDGGLRPGKQIVGYDFPVSPDIVVQVTSLRAQSRYFSDLIQVIGGEEVRLVERISLARQGVSDRKSTRLNSSHANISYAVFCLKKKKIVLRTLALIKLIYSTLVSTYRIAILALLLHAHAYSKSI